MLRGPERLLLLALAPLVLLASGCQLVLPETAIQPVVHNPFPQLSRVAVVPFFNQSAEATVDGRAFALAYFAELQAVPGFEVVPVAAVEAIMQQHGITFPPDKAVEQARLLGRLLGVDAVVIGAVTDFNEFYPPRCGMRVEWYATNPGYHPIPAGYGLPWGTPDEEYIPDRLVFEAEMELARAQMATQEPMVMPSAVDQPKLLPLQEPPPIEPTPRDTNADPFEETAPPALESAPAATAPGTAAPNPLRDSGDASGAANALRGAAYEERAGATGTTDASRSIPMAGATPMLPPDWPDARGLTPPGPQPTRPIAAPYSGPVMTHTRVFRSTDPDFTAALASYVDFRDDARFGGWQSYLTRSEDFIRFCCHLHVVEMLSARGGGGETRVVRRWSASR